MKLLEFLDMLSDMELSQINYGKKDEKGKFIYQDSLVGLINRGLQELHQKFIIRKGEAIVNVNKSKNYRVDITDNKYVLNPDSHRNIIKIIQIFNSCGQDIDFNTINRNNCYPLEQIQLINKTTLIFDKCFGCYKVISQLGPKLLNNKYIDYDTDIDIPLEFINALVYYVAMNLHAINPSKQEYANVISPTVTYAKRYKEEIAELKALGMDIDGMGNNYQRMRDSSFI